MTNPLRGRHALVVGAGVVGLASARALALAGCEVIIAERAERIGTGVSSRNSEVIHAGMYYPGGSLRARHCVAGQRMLHAFCAKRGIPHRKCGKLIVAVNDRERAKIEAIHAQGIVNDVEGLRLLEREDHGGMIAFNSPIEQIRPAPMGSDACWSVHFGGADPGVLGVDIIVKAARIGAQTLARATEGYPAALIPSKCSQKAIISPIRVDRFSRISSTPPLLMAGSVHM